MGVYNMYIHSLCMHVYNFCISVSTQTVTEAMRTMDPPVKLGDPANEEHLKYVEEQSSRTDFEFTPVSQEHPY